MNNPNWKDWMVITLVTLIVSGSVIAAALCR